MRVGDVERQAAIGRTLAAPIHPQTLDRGRSDAEFVSVNDISGKLFHASRLPLEAKADIPTEGFSVVVIKADPIFRFAIETQRRRHSCRNSSPKL